jgi:hypothetical protein
LSLSCGGRFRQPSLTCLRTGRRGQLSTSPSICHTFSPGRIATGVARRNSVTCGIETSGEANIHYREECVRGSIPERWQFELCCERDGDRQVEAGFQKRIVAGRRFTVLGPCHGIRRRTYQKQCGAAPACTRVRLNSVVFASCPLVTNGPLRRMPCQGRRKIVSVFPVAGSALTGLAK